MEERLNQVINCFEQDQLSRLLTIQELRTKLEPIFDETQLELILTRSDRIRQSFPGI